MIRARELARVWSQAVQHLADGHWHALASSAHRLGVSPERLRAALRQFLRMGAPLQCDPYRGLRFVQPVTTLSPARERFSLPVQACCVTDSTNALALNALGAGLARRKAWVAEYQTLGRGRAQRRWLQGMGCGLSVSLAFPANQPVALDALSLRVGLALAEALQRLVVRDVELKWPNDVLWQGKKMGGILIEARGAGVVVGIGLNHLRRRHEERAIDQPVASLQDALGRRLPRRARVLAGILRAVHDELREVSATWSARFARFDALKGRPVRVIEPSDVTWGGVAEGVDAQGFLQVNTTQGLRVCRAGDVSVRLDKKDQRQVRTQ